MTVVEDPHRRLVLGVVGGSRLLVAGQRRLDFRGEGLAEPVRFRHPEGHARRRVGDDDAAQALGMVEGVFHREHATPGLSDDGVARGDAQVLRERKQLVLEELRRPELGGRIR